MWGADRAKGGRTTPNHCSEPAQRIPVWIWGYRYPSQPPSYSTPGWRPLGRGSPYTRSGKWPHARGCAPRPCCPPSTWRTSPRRRPSHIFPISPGWIYPRCSCCTWTARWAPRRCSWPRWSTKGSSWWHFGLRIWCICRSANSAAALPWRSSLARGSRAWRGALADPRTRSRTSTLPPCWARSPPPRGSRAHPQAREVSHSVRNTPGSRRLQPGRCWRCLCCCVDCAWSRSDASSALHSHRRCAHRSSTETSWMTWRSPRLHRNPNPASNPPGSSPRIYPFLP